MPIARASRCSTRRSSRATDAGDRVTAGLVLGFVTGLTYGLLAVGIVLIFKANRFINIAHAQLGAVSALLLGRLVLENGWSWWEAFPFVLTVGIVTGLLIERIVIRPLLNRQRS